MYLLDSMERLIEANYTRKWPVNTLNIQLVEE